MSRARELLARERARAESELHALRKREAVDELTVCDQHPADYVGRAGRRRARAAPGPQRAGAAGGDRAGGEAARGRRQPRARFGGTHHSESGVNRNRILSHFRESKSEPLGGREPAQRARPGTVGHESSVGRARWGGLWELAAARSRRDHPLGRAVTAAIDVDLPYARDRGRPIARGTRDGGSSTASPSTKKSRNCCVSPDDILSLPVHQAINLWIADGIPRAAFVEHTLPMEPLYDAAPAELRDPSVKRGRSSATSCRSPPTMNLASRRALQSGRRRTARPTPHRSPGFPARSSDPASGRRCTCRAGARCT